ncbi:cell division topological specificity factor MinE [Gayadomonas joobiniege]|uniref:cell division topological specificity factor MinE n=1 Tax=Gayadomonas joobiniege TaxID=1234606 RepID=UPI000376727B|nr:cell division topological specificity factor MinE [Gayadomonas joobiniege]
MSLMDYFKPKKTNAASQAKERLQIIVAQRRRADSQSENLSALEKDILEVIRKYYMNVEESAIQLHLEQKEEDISVLELNVTLPDDKESK